VMPLLFISFAVGIWNIITFALYGIDKRKAQKGNRRISENTLILCAFLMGGLGAFVGMAFFRHKTKHLKFRILVPLSLVLNIVVAVLILNHFEIFSTGGFL